MALQVLSVRYNVVALTMRAYFHSSIHCPLLKSAKSSEIPRKFELYSSSRSSSLVPMKAHRHMQLPISH